MKRIMNSIFKTIVKCEMQRRTPPSASLHPHLFFFTHSVINRTSSEFLLTFSEIWWLRKEFHFMSRRASKMKADEWELIDIKQKFDSFNYRTRSRDQMRLKSELWTQSIHTSETVIIIIARRSYHRSQRSWVETYKNHQWFQITATDESFHSSFV